MNPLQGCISEAAKGDPLPDPSPHPSAKGMPVIITKGKIAVGDFLEFLSDYTGLPVLHNSGDPTLESREIQILGTIKGADEAMVMAILEANGIRVFKEELPGGRKVIKVESLLPDQGFADEPRPRPIIKVTPGSENRKSNDAIRSAAPRAKDADLEARVRDLEAKMEEVLQAIRELRAAKEVRGSQR